MGCFPDKTGYAVGAIEGRCSIVSFEDPAQTFTFRCHRTAEEFFPVNSVDFHPSEGTFATAGADGAYVFWDRKNRHRLNQSSSRACPISAAKFNVKGDLFAYAVSYDWSKGPDPKMLAMPHQVMIHHVEKQDVLARPKAKKKSK